MSCIHFHTVSHCVWVLDDDLQLPCHLPAPILKLALCSGLCHAAARPSRRAPSRDEAPGTALLLIIIGDC